MNNPLVQYDIPNPYFVNGLRMTYLTSSTLSVNAGSCRDTTNTNTLVLSATATLSTASNGAGGLDTGTIAANTLYYVYVIGDSTQFRPTAVIASAAVNTIAPFSQLPVFPTGYDIAFRVGAFRTDGSSNILAFHQENYEMFYDAPILIVSAGNATTSTAVSLLGLMPPQSMRIQISAGITPGTAGDIVSVGTPPNKVTSGCVTTKKQFGSAYVPTSAPYPVNVNYLVSSSGDAVDIYLVSYKDVLIP